MLDNLEKLIKLVYGKYRSGRSLKLTRHPDDETFACFIDGKLSVKEEEGIRQHLIECGSCAQAVAIQIKTCPDTELDVSPGLLAAARDILSSEKATPALEVFLRLKEGLFELLSTNGDVLLGQEFIPALVLRSRQVKEFKDEIMILKDLGSIRVEIKVEKKSASIFSLSVIAKDRQSSQVIKDLRVTLMKEDLELESYINDLGKVVFEHIALGKYTVEIADLKEKLAAILLDIKA
jgi:hypothetical protein